MNLVGDGPFAAPDLIFAEVGNALWRHVAAGLLTSERAAEGMTTVEKSIDFVQPLAPLARRALAIACQLGHPVCDCYYLALAEGLDTRLLTADRRLARRVADTPYMGLVQVLA